MSPNKFIPVPYFQFVPLTADYDLSKPIYKEVPNKKIHRHCPYIIIDVDYINEPHMDVAIATDEYPSTPPKSDSTPQANPPQQANSTQNDKHENSEQSDSPVNQAVDSEATSQSTSTERPTAVKPITDKSAKEASSENAATDSPTKSPNNSPNVTESSNKQELTSEELTAKEKDRLDFLAKLKADPANAKAYQQQDTNLANEAAATDEQTQQNTAPCYSKENSNVALVEVESADAAEGKSTNSEITPKNSSDSADTTVVTNNTAKADKQLDTSLASKDKKINTKKNDAKTDDDTEHNQDITATNKTDNDNKKQSGADVSSDKDIGKDNENDKNKKDKKDSKEKDEDKELTEEEKQKKEKEAKLESYKQFVAEQKSKVDIDYAGIRVDIEANALPNRLYFIMNALSAIIASYGLVINSAAVVIGAMLVAMMLGPISGVALAIIDYRMPFLRKSLITVLSGATMVILIGYIVGYLHQDSPLTNEILSRTQPTSMDLMIALAGGTAGAYAMISPHLSVAVVGVAVATALVPPLAASGILFAYGEGSLGLGALLLALTNIIAIQFTNALVLWFSGFRRLVDDDYKSSPMVAFFRRNAVPLLLLAGIGSYLTYNFNAIRKKQLFENEVSESINEYFIDKGNALTTTQFLSREDHQTVRAVLRGETQPTTADAQYLESQINHKIELEYPKYQPVRLQFRYMPVIVIESNPAHTDALNKTDAAILSNE